jgi:hypothetical protein
MKDAMGIRYSLYNRREDTMRAGRISRLGLLASIPVMLGACADQNPLAPDAAKPSLVAAEIGGRIYGLTGNGYSLQARANVLGSVQVLIPRVGDAGVDACDTSLPRTSSLTSFALAPLANVGLLRTEVEPLVTSVGEGIRVTNVTGGVNLLGGLITADEIVSIALARTHTPTSTLAIGSTGSRFTNLRILGSTLSATPEPNTRIELPGIGYVVLYEREPRAVRNQQASMSVVMLRVVVNQQNSLGLAVGTELLVGRAFASIGERGTTARLGGSAYAASVSGALNLNLAPAAATGVGCDGTPTGPQTASTASISLPGVLVAEGLTSRARGVLSADSAASFTESAVGELSLLGGLVSATGVRATARAEKVGSSIVREADGTFASLTIAGQAVDVSNIVPNTQINLAGIGTVWLKRVIQNGNSVEIRMIEVVTNVDNPLLPLNATIRVGVAGARVLP